MSKHHAPEEESPASEMSWIRGLAKPADQAPDATLPFYNSLVTRAPRHAEPVDEAADAVAANYQTGSIRRISAAQVDTVIGRLDGLSELLAHEPGADQDAPDQDTTGQDAPDQDTTGQDAPDQDTTGQDTPDQDTTDQDTTDQNTTDQDSDVAGEVPADDAAVDSSQTSEFLAAEPVADRQTAARGLSRPARARLRKPALVGAAAVLCLLTVGGGTVTAMEKTVSLVIDGKVQIVSTMSGSVAGALASAGITATSHDAVAPAVDASIADGSTIVLDRGRLMTVTVDGQQKQIWTTARNAQEAEAQLGSRNNRDLAPAANRSRTIPLAGTPSIVAAPPRTSETIRTVTVSVAGGPVKQHTTAAATVGKLLKAMDISVGPHDTVSPGSGTKLRNGLFIRVNRVSISTTSSARTLAPPAPTSIEDATIVKGTSTVVQQGEPGSEVSTYAVTTVNGRPVSKVVTGTKIVVRPVGQITHVGTKTSFTYSGSEVFTNDTEFGVNWDGLAMCESTHNPKAVNANPSAGLPTYGMFQFDIPTWESVGGSGNPMDASPEEQLMRAKLLFQSRGLEPWACRDAAH